MNKEIKDMLRVPHEWNGKILDKLSYATFTVETEDSYNKGLEVKRIEDEETARTGKVFYDCNHVPVANSLSIKVNTYNYEKLIEEKYNELYSKFGDRVSKNIYLT